MGEAAKLSEGQIKKITRPSNKFLLWTFLISLASASIGSYVTDHLLNSDDRERARESGISYELYKEYKERDVEFQYPSWLHKKGFTPELLDKFKEEGLKDEPHDLVLFYEGFNADIYNRWSEQGFKINDVLANYKAGSSLERAIEWRSALEEGNVDQETYKELHLADISLEEALDLTSKEYSPDTIWGYLDKNIEPVHIPLLVKEEITPSMIGTIYDHSYDDEQLAIKIITSAKQGKFSGSIYNQWKESNFNDMDIAFCIINDYSLDEAKRWREKDYSVKEMHKYKQLPELLGIE